MYVKVSTSELSKVRQTNPVSELEKRQKPKSLRKSKSRLVFVQVQMRKCDENEQVKDAELDSG